MTNKSYKAALARAQATPEFMAEVLATEFITEVWRAMKDQGLSQTALAEKLGKRRSYLSRVLTGPHNLTLHTIAEFFAALGEEPHLRTKPIGHQAQWITFQTEMRQNKGTGKAGSARWSDAAYKAAFAPIEFTSGIQTANQDNFALAA